MNTQAPSRTATIATAALQIINNRWNRPDAPDMPDGFPAVWAALPAESQAEIDGQILEMEALDWFDEPKSKWQKRLIVADVWATWRPQFIRHVIKETRELLAAGTTPTPEA